MKLQEWLNKEERSRSWLARKMNPSVTPAAVDGWCDPISPKKPRIYHIREIERITQGEVTEKCLTPKNRRLYANRRNQKQQKSRS